MLWKSIEEYQYVSCRTFYRRTIGWSTKIASLTYRKQTRSIAWFIRYRLAVYDNHTFKIIPGVLSRFVKGNLRYICIFTKHLFGLLYGVLRSSACYEISIFVFLAFIIFTNDLELVTNLTNLPRTRYSITRFNL